MIHAAAIVIAHNHPSGNPEPSPEDVRVTREICKAGRLLGIDVLDPTCYPQDPPHPKYKNGWDGPLKGCEKDARDMCAIAESQGFSTTLLLTREATADNVEAAIRNAASTLKRGDFFLLTYAGHGGQVLVSAAAGAALKQIRV